MLHDLRLSSCADGPMTWFYALILAMLGFLDTAWTTFESQKEKLVAIGHKILGFVRAVSASIAIAIKESCPFRFGKRAHSAEKARAKNFVVIRILVAGVLALAGWLRAPRFPLKRPTPDHYLPKKNRSRHRVRNAALLLWSSFLRKRRPSC